MEIRSTNGYFRTEGVACNYREIVKREFTREEIQDSVLNAFLQFDVIFAIGCNQMFGYHHYFLIVHAKDLIQLIKRLRNEKPPSYKSLIYHAQKFYNNKAYDKLYELDMTECDVYVLKQNRSQFHTADSIEDGSSILELKHVSFKERFNALDRRTKHILSSLN